MIAVVVRVGTFNLNNLFSRYNFSARVEAAPQSGGGITLEFDDDRDYKVRTFMGKLVKGKDARDTKAIANRIKNINVDVLAVQEVEHIEVLKTFNKEFLDGMYSHIALIEGNDRRFIDVGVLSKFPLGGITSYQAIVHPDDPAQRVFGRDLLRVEIMDQLRSKKLFSLYNTHLKSHLVPFFEDQVQGAINANARRKRQAEMISDIIFKAERPNSAFILTGDMNDPVESDHLAPMLEVDGNSLINGLQNPTETRAPKAESRGPGPQTPAWTYRHPVTGLPPEFKLYDHIWLSPSLATKMQGAFIDRRTKHGGDGSDHDPAWVELDV